MVNQNPEESQISLQSIHNETSLAKLLDLGRMAYDLDEKEIIQKTLSFGSNQSSNALLVTCCVHHGLWPDIPSIPSLVVWRLVLHVRLGDKPS